MTFSSDLEINRSEVIRKEQELFSKVSALENKLCLNLGCGNRLLKGFTNVDKYSKNFGVLNYDIFKLPYEDQSVDIIFCAHVLEHLPIRHARMAMKEWSRVFRSGGQLYLGIPDIEIIMTQLLIPGLTQNEREWLMYTLFGFQTDPANRNPEILDYPIDDGQFHTCGFTKETIKNELTEVGLKCTNIMNYDGWGTPSIWVEACKS